MSTYGESLLFVKMERRQCVFNEFHVSVNKVVESRGWLAGNCVGNTLPHTVLLRRSRQRAVEDKCLQSGCLKPTDCSMVLSLSDQVSFEN